MSTNIWKMETGWMNKEPGNQRDLKLKLFGVAKGEMEIEQGVGMAAGSQ